MTVHVCGVCWVATESHSPCPCGRSHVTPPCCLGCGCLWFEETHPHLLVSAGPNRMGTKTDVGDFVVMAKGHRYGGRVGEVMERVWVPAGGAGDRRAYRVRLFPRGKAKGREIVCYPSSTEPVKVDESRI